jgi:penicillin-binding protein
MNSEILLADSGYGQGQVLFNSLTLPRALTAIADGGKLKSLRLLFTKNPVEQKEVLSEATAQKILGYMEKVVADPQGTGYVARMEGYTFAGKTGTSEVGSGSSAQENSWLTLINRDPQHPSIVTMMVENTKDLDGTGLMAGKMKTYWTSLPQP